MKNIEILKEMLADKGITIGEGFKLVINEGEQKQYHFKKDNGAIAAAIFARVIDGMKSSELAKFVNEVLIPAFESEACGDFKNNNIEPSETLIGLLKSGEIIPAAVNKEANLEFVNRYVHRDVMDLSLYYRLIVKNDEGGLSSIIIDEHMLEITGITEEELFDRAKKYIQKHMECASMADIFAGTAMESELREQEDANCDMLVVRYGRSLFGAGVLAMAAIDEEILSCQSEQYPVYILPSSIHELILVKDRSERGIEADYICDQITDVNIYRVEVEELLSNSLYVLQPTGKVELVKKGKPLDFTISEKKRLESFLRCMMGYEGEAEAV